MLYAMHMLQTSINSHLLSVNEYAYLFFQLLILENGRKVGSLPVDYEPSSLSINPVSGDVAVGGSMDNKVRPMNRAILNSARELQFHWNAMFMFIFCVPFTLSVYLYSQSTSYLFVCRSTCTW